ncbi:unnamed protein product [Closterium sp. Naga37s-1]|nr:unnamed protein product [Closterium sp. Naga37s-1]
MGTSRPRKFLLALVLVASLNFLAAFAALPPDGDYDINEPAGLKESYDARALLEAESEAAVDSVDWVESDNSEDPRILADVAADLKQPSESDGARGSAKKSPLEGQAGTNARAPGDSAASPNGKSSAAAPKKGKQGTKRQCVRRRSTFESNQKKGAGAVSTSGADSNSGAAPQPRALLGADSDDSIDWIDSVDFEDPRVLRTMADAAVDLKQPSDDLSGAMKDSLGQAGRNVRNSVDKMLHTRNFAPKGGKKHHGGRKPTRGSAPKRNSGAVLKPPAAPAVAKPGIPTKLQGAKYNSGAAPNLPGAPAAGTSGAGNKPGKGNSGAAPKLPTAPAAGKPGGGIKSAKWRAKWLNDKPLMK